MGPSNALAATGLMIASGPRELYDSLAPILAPMTGKVRYLGERPDLAAAYKLFGNMMIMFVTAGIADVYSLARGLGIDPVEAHTLFDDFDPGTQVKGRGKRMAEGDYIPQFELSAARKDVRLMLESAAAVGAVLHTLPAIARLQDEAIEAGHRADDLGAIADPALP